MSILMSSPGFNTPRAIIEYALGKTNQGDTVIVLRRALDDDTYQFIATGTDSDLKTLRQEGYLIVDEFTPNTSPVYDRDRLTHSDDRCC